MTFAQIKALVKDRLYENGTLPSGNFLTDLDRIVNDGLTILYNDMADRAPSLFAKRSADLVYDPAAGIPLTAKLETGDVEPVGAAPDCWTLAGFTATEAQTITFLVSANYGAESYFRLRVTIAGVDYTSDPISYAEWGNEIALTFATPIAGATLTYTGDDAPADMGGPGGGAPGNSWTLAVTQSMPEYVHLVTGVEIKTSSGVYLPLEPLSVREVGAVGGDVIGVTGDAPCVGWFMENFVLYLAPRPKSAQTVRLVYVPAVTELSAAGDFPFNGLFPNFHMLVAYEAITLAGDKDHMPQTLYRTWGRLKKQLDNYLSKLQAQRPRRVERTDEYEDDFD